MGILTSWVCGLRIYSSGLLWGFGLSSGWESSTSVRWCSRFPDGIRVEVYASGGASFACCYILQYQVYVIYIKGRPISLSSGSLATFGGEVFFIGRNGGRSGRSTVRVEQLPIGETASLEHSFGYESSTPITKVCLRVRGTTIFSTKHVYLQRY